VAELRVDDIVEVLRYRWEGAGFMPHWVPAIVMHIEDHKIEVKKLKGAFDEAGHDLLALPKSEYGRMWRR
jgi:hypothetical protein